MNDPRTGKRTPQGKRPRSNLRGPGKSELPIAQKHFARGSAGVTVEIRPRTSRGGQSQFRPTVKNFADLFRAPTAERVKVIKNGVRAVFVLEIAKSMGASKDALLRQLGLSRATIDRKVKNDRALSTDEGQRVIGMAKLVGLVETMAEQSDNSKSFDAAKWLAKWIDQELPAFGGKKPAEFLDTAEGQELVANTLQRMQSGAYS